MARLIFCTALEGCLRCRHPHDFRPSNHTADRGDELVERWVRVSVAGCTDDVEVEGEGVFQEKLSRGTVRDDRRLCASQPTLGEARAPPRVTRVAQATRRRQTVSPVGDL